MNEDPLDVVYSLVERTYIRLQAGDILIRCMEDGNPGPMHQMVESLVLAGPDSLNLLRELISETDQRRTQVLDDLGQVFMELEIGLKSYGVQLNGIKGAYAVASLSSVHFLSMLREQKVFEEQRQVECLQLLRDCRELMLGLIGHVQLLEEIERYLEDWLWGLVYQSAKQWGSDRKPLRGSCVQL